jgi:hypothetical protein
MSATLSFESARSGGRRNMTLASRSVLGSWKVPVVVATASQITPAWARILIVAYSADRKKLRSDSRRVRRMVEAA